VKWLKDLWDMVVMGGLEPPTTASSFSQCDSFLN